MKTRSRPWTGSWEDYFGVGWWSLKFSIPHWFRSDLHIQGLLPDLKQAIKEAAVISCQAQEPSRSAASRSQRHVYRFMVEQGWKRPRGSTGYARRDIGIMDLSCQEKIQFDRFQFRESVRRQLSDILGPEAWDRVWSWANSNEYRIPADVTEILGGILCG